MRFTVFLLFYVGVIDLSGQFAIRPFYVTNHANGWDAFFTEVNGAPQRLFATGYGAALEYQIAPFENTRIEFYPYLSYQQSTTTIVGIGDFGFRQIGAGVSSQAYILKLFGDCTCPTFHRDGNILEKGFFISVGAGVDYDAKSILDQGYDDQNIDVVFSGGVGLDIGLNDQMTITPLLQVHYYPEVSWHELGPPLGRPSGNISTSLMKYTFGIRMTLDLQRRR